MRPRPALCRVLVLFAVAACSSKVPEAQKPAAAPRPVALVTVGTTDLPRLCDVTGALAPLEELVLGFQVAGRLREVAVDVGDAITERQLLVALDDQDFALARERARASLMASRVRLGLAADAESQAVDIETAAPVREALAVLAQAKLQRDRTVQMVREDLRAQAELDAAEASCEVAASRVQGAREQVRTWIAENLQRTVELQQSQKNLDDSKLLAPWPGRVSERRAVAGQYVQVGAPVLTLLRTDPMRLRLQVPERMAGQVKIGMPVHFTVDGGDGQERIGTVQRLGAGIDRQSRTLLVEAEVQNKDDALRAGGFCRASIVLAAATPVVAVPKSAVVSFAGIDRVFAVADGKAKEVQVKLGRDAGELVEIVSGVAAGARIVQQARGLVTGTAVAVQG